MSLAGVLHTSNAIPNLLGPLPPLGFYLQKS